MKSGLKWAAGVLMFVVMVVLAGGWLPGLLALADPNVFQLSGYVCYTEDMVGNPPHCPTGIDWWLVVPTAAASWLLSLAAVAIGALMVAVVKFFSNLNRAVIKYLNEE